MNQKGVTPLVATVLLIAFSIALGAVVMSWGETYVEEKAEFVKGAEEVRTGCDAAKIDVIKLAGAEQICVKGNVIEMMLENGPDIELFDVQARVVGSQDIAVVESTLPMKPMPKEYAMKVSFGIKPVGKVLQVKLTPKIKTDDTVVFCAESGKTFENIRNCE